MWALALVIALLIVPSTARADAIDLWWVMTRSRGWDDSPVSAGLFAAALMGFNYLLNLLVVGVPAREGLVAAGRSIGIEVALLSLAAQVVDRIGCVVGLVAALLLVSLFVTGSEGLYIGALSGLVLNFVFSGIGLGALVRFFNRRRWHLDHALVKRLSIRAAVVTNPAWLMFATFFQQPGA